MKSMVRFSAWPSMSSWPARMNTFSGVALAVEVATVSHTQKLTHVRSIEMRFMKSELGWRDGLADEIGICPQPNATKIHFVEKAPPPVV